MLSFYATVCRPLTARIEDHTEVFFNLFFEASLKQNAGLARNLSGGSGEEVLGKGAAS